MSANQLPAIRQAVVNLNTKEAQRLVQEALDAGLDPAVILDEALVPGLNEVGAKYSAGEYYLAELVLSAEVMKRAVKILEPHLAGRETKKLGKVVAGTVKGDLHDIGKNILVALLQANGFEVIDLGSDVSPQRFVEAAIDSSADILAMSALLTTTMPMMGTAVDLLKERGHRDRVKVIIGGAPVTPEFTRRIQADGSSTNAVVGVEICKEWVLAITR
jgi:5-methyltetrahydrofolate--homocysteine methyltransferase